MGAQTWAVGVDMSLTLPGGLQSAARVEPLRRETSFHGNDDVASQIHSHWHSVGWEGQPVMGWDQPLSDSRGSEAASSHPVQVFGALQNAKG